MAKGQSPWSSKGVIGNMPDEELVGAYAYVVARLERIPKNKRRASLGNYSYVLDEARLRKEILRRLPERRGRIALAKLAKGSKNP